MRIWLKLTKKWGEFAIGDDALFDERKGNDLIAKGIAQRIKMAKIEDSSVREKPAFAETATHNEAPENADARPKGRSKKDIS